MNYIKITSIAMLCILAGCVAKPAPLTPLEIQSMQTREFEQDKSIVFASIMSVFQDLGYTIKSADKDTGFITAESASKSDGSSKFWHGVSKVSQTKGTAFIETIGKITRARLNFVSAIDVSYYRGQTDRNDTPILNAQMYQNAFERIENAIFVRSAN